MARTKRKKELIYKDTFEFGLFPKYEYTKFQQKRFRLFQGRVEHYRKAINYADSFDDPNVINLLYLIGYNDKIRPYVLKHTNNNTVVLCADVPEKIRKIHDAYKELCDKAYKWGGTNYVQDDALTDTFLEYCEAMVRRGTEEAQKEFAEYIQISDAYEVCKNDCQKYFKRYIIEDKLHPEKTIAHENIDWIIKRYFPRGREQTGCDDIILLPAKISRAFLSGLKGDDNSKLFMKQGKFNADLAFKPSIKRCLMNINTALRDVGYVDLLKIANEMKAPPYGWDNDLYAAYSFGAALRDFVDNAFIFDGVSAFKLTEEYAVNIVSMILKGDEWSKRRLAVTLYTNDAWRLVNRFAFIFGVKEELSFEQMRVNVVNAVREHTVIPIGIIDDNITKILRRDDDCISFANADLKSMLKYLTWNRCKDIKDKYEHINDYATAWLVEQFPQTSLPCDRIFECCTTSESGWLWDSEFFKGVVDGFIKKGA